MNLDTMVTNFLSLPHHLAFITRYPSLVADWVLRLCPLRGLNVLFLFVSVYHLSPKNINDPQLELENSAKNEQKSRK